MRDRKNPLRRGGEAGGAARLGASNSSVTVQNNSPIYGRPDGRSSAREYRPSQRLPEALLKLHAIGPADAQAVRVLQNEFELSVRNRLKLNDAVYVHDERSMNADESQRIEMVT